MSVSKIFPSANTDVNSNLRERLEALLRSESDRGALLRELITLAQEKEFRDLAAIWAPALYDRSARFFETFLLRHLDGRRHADVIRDLLPHIEAAGHDSLFQGLYRKVAREDEWNKELITLARSHDSDENVLRAVQRREMRREWFSLTEETALALYRRNPTLFREFLQGHVRRRWIRKSPRFESLRDEAKRQNDDELYWFLFREFTEEKEWKQELQRLLRQDTPASQIAEELQKRHPRYAWKVDAGIMVDFLEKYEAAVLPYVESNIFWIAHRADRKRLFLAVERLGHEALYWRLFFKVGSSQMWNDALRKLLKRPLSNEELSLELQRRTPPEQRWSWWQLEDDVALAIYRRHHTPFRPFLERFALQPDVALFREAERADDEEFLDFVTFRFMRKLSWLVYRAFPPESARRWGRKPDEKARREWEEIVRLVTTRFDRLYAQSPETYVRHAANVLSRFRAYEIWSFKRERERNPVFVYLIEQHHDVWRRSPDAIRELLESPNIYIQILGLEILSEGGPEAAQRVVENLPMLRALLLGRARRGTKKKALQCLERAARQSPDFAAQILPVLEETMDFRGKRAIDERIMVSFVRVRRQMAQVQE